MKKTSILIALSISFGAAHAEFWDGNRLLQRLESSSMYDQGTAIGYIMGVADALFGVTQCAPSNVTAGQIQDMVRNYLVNVPAERHNTADIIVSRVLRNSWPCADRQQRRGQAL